MAKTWNNIQDYIEIKNNVADTELDAIDNQDEDNVFFINDDSEYENVLLIALEEEKNYEKNGDNGLA